MFKINPFLAIIEAVRLFPKVLLWFLVCFAPYFVMGVVLESLLVIALQMILGIFVYGILCLSLEEAYYGETKSFGVIINNFISNFNIYCKRYCLLMLTVIFWCVILGIAGAALAAIITGGGYTRYGNELAIVGFIIVGIIFITMIIKFLLPMCIAVPHVFLGSPQKIWAESKELVYGHRLSLCISLAIPAILSGFVMSQIEAGSLSLVFLIFPMFLAGINSIIAFIYYKRIT